MTRKIIECVPNFSEGRYAGIQITAEIEKIEGVSLLDVDPGSYNVRYNLVGTPEAVVEAASRPLRRPARL